MGPSYELFAGVRKRNGREMRPGICLPLGSGAPPGLIHQAADYARGLLRAIVSSSRTPTLLKDWRTRKAYRHRVGDVAALRTGAAAAAPRALPRAPFRPGCERLLNLFTNNNKL